MSILLAKLFYRNNTFWKVATQARINENWKGRINETGKKENIANSFEYEI